MKRELLINLIELRLLVQLFLIDNNNIQNKIKDIIIILMKADPQEDYTKLLNYNKEQLERFCNANIDKILEGF